MKMYTLQLRNTIILSCFVVIYYLIIGAYSIVAWFKDTGGVYNLSLPLVGGGFISFLFIFLFSFIDERVGYLLTSTSLVTAGFAHGTNPPGRVILFLISALIQIYSTIALYETYRARLDSKFKKTLNSYSCIRLTTVKGSYILMLLAFIFVMNNAIIDKPFSHPYLMYIIGCMFIVSSIISKNSIERSMLLLLGCSLITIKLGSFMHSLNDNKLYYVIPSLLMLASSFFTQNYKVFGLKKSDNTHLSRDYLIVLGIVFMIFIFGLIYLHYTNTP